MPGSINLNSPSYLPTLLGPSTPGTSLLASLHRYAGAAPRTTNPGTADPVADPGAGSRWQASLGQTTPGLSNAIDFTERASTITSVDQVLSDPTFRTVVTTALGVPEQTGSQSPAAQKQAISAGVDVTKFKDPAFVTQFAQRYLIAARQAVNGPSDTTVPDLPAQSAGFVV
jgi:hypothetical protein